MRFRWLPGMIVAHRVTADEFGQKELAYVGTSLISPSVGTPRGNKEDFLDI